MEPRPLRYGESVYHTVDVYGDGPHLLVFVHGGLYVNGDKAEHAALASLLATEQWAVAVVNYRLSGASSKDHVVRSQEVGVHACLSAHMVRE